MSTSFTTTYINVQSPPYNPFGALQLPNAPCSAQKVFMTNQSAPFEPSPLQRHFESQQFVPNFTMTDNQVSSAKPKPFSLSEFEKLSGSSQRTRVSLDSNSQSSGLSDYEEGEISPRSTELKKASSTCLEVQPGQTQWKAKVRTEFCKFWLGGKPCDNRDKEQGCGFAHGEHELQRKLNLNKQYLTSVCKNFIEHPSKCNYGDRCIFQHPSLDISKKQKYEDIFTENVKYTAMRLFQNIPGAETVYVNAYALQTPRLAAFKHVAPNHRAKK